LKTRNDSLGCEAALFGSKPLARRIEGFGRVGTTFLILCVQGQVDERRELPRVD
jgi:hypothetical protein